MLANSPASLQHQQKKKRETEGKGKRCSRPCPENGVKICHSSALGKDSLAAKVVRRKQKKNVLDVLVAFGVANLCLVVDSVIGAVVVVVVAPTILITVTVLIVVIVPASLFRHHVLMLQEAKTLRQRTLQEVLHRHRELILKPHAPLLLRLRGAAVHLPLQYIATRRLLEGQLVGVVRHVVAGQTVLNDAHKASKVHVTEAQRDAALAIELRRRVVRIRLAWAELRKLRDEQQLAIDGDTRHAPLRRHIPHIVNLEPRQHLRRREDAAVRTRACHQRLTHNGARLEPDERHRRRCSCSHGHPLGHKAKHDAFLLFFSIFLNDQGVLFFSRGFFLSFNTMLRSARTSKTRGDKNEEELQDIAFRETQDSAREKKK